MGVKTRGKNLPASVVARYSGRQQNLMCNICNRTFSYDKNLQKHMTLHSNTSAESCATKMCESSADGVSSLRGEMESTESVVAEVSASTGGKVLPLAVMKIMNGTEITERSSKDQISGDHLQNCISGNGNGFPEDQPLRDSCDDTDASMVLEDAGNQSVHAFDITTSLAPTAVLAKENLDAGTSGTSSIHPEVQIALSNQSALLCDFRESSLSNTHNFQQHHIVHNGEMSLECYYCKCSFSEQTEWEEHLAIHSKANITQEQDQEYIRYEEIQPHSDSNVSPQTSAHCASDAETMLVKLNLDLNDKPVTHDSTITATEMANVRSGRLEQLIEALTKEVAQSSVDIQGETPPKCQYSTVPVKNALKNLVILQTNSVPADSVNTYKEFTERTVLSSKQYQCRFCPRSFPRACHLTNHEKIHTRGKQNPSHANPLMNRSPPAMLESSSDIKSPLVPCEEIVDSSSVKSADLMIQDAAQSKEQILSSEPGQSHPCIPVYLVGQQWSCDVCSKECINESHLLRHQKIHAKRKRNNRQLPALIGHPPQPSDNVWPSQEESAENTATSIAFLQNSETNDTLIPEEISCFICRKKLDSLSEEKIVNGSPSNILCTICMLTNQISDKKGYSQNLRSSKTKSTMKYRLEKIIKKMHQNRQSRKYDKSWFYVSKLKVTKSIRTSQKKIPFFCKLCKKKFLNKWSLWCHCQHHSGSKRTAFHLQSQNRYFFRWKEWLTFHDNHIYSCPNCDKSFKSLGRFSVHRRSHRMDYFVCGQCDLRFFLKNSLRYHSLKCGRDSTLGLSTSDSVELHVRDGTQFTNEESKLTPNEKPGHSESGTSIMKWECKTCGDHFDQAIQLVQHYQTDHTESKPFQCPFCRQLCNSTKQALDHLSSHAITNSKASREDESSNPQTVTDDSSFNLHSDLFCSICEKSLPSLKDLKTHLNSHSAMALPVQVGPTTDDDVAETEKHHLSDKSSPQNNVQRHSQTQIGDKLHLCEFCGKSFDDSNNLQAHCLLHVVDRPYKCSHCNKSFSQNDTYKRHVQTHTHSYHCRVCGKCYQSSNELEQHQRESNHHLNDSRNVLPSKRLPSPYTYKCDVCQKVVRNLKIHMRIHDPDPDTVYKCNICPKTFLQSGNLKQHLMMHSGERPLRCEFCDKGFIHSSHLKRHRQTHTGERPHQCEFCQRSFAERAKLRMHLRTHTKEKPYTCDYKGCDKSFSLKSVLDAHQLLHTGERPHSCEECGRSFTQRCNLIAHRRIHTGERPFKCTICQRAFRNSSNLKDHERLHSDDRPFKCHLCSKVFKRSDYLAKHLLIHSNEQSVRSKGNDKSGSKRMVLNQRRGQQSEITGEGPKHSYLPSESSQVTMKSTCNSSPAKVNKKVKISSPLAVSQIENGFDLLIKTFSQEAVTPSSELVSGSVLDGYSGCGTVENVIEIYTEQDAVSGQMGGDNLSELTSSIVGPQIVSSGPGDDSDSLESSLMLGNHVMQEKGENQADIAQQTEIENALRRHSSDSPVPVENSGDVEAVCETLNSGTAERLVCQSASDDQSEISNKTLGHLSELLYYLTDYVKGDLEFQLIGNGPKLHLNSIRQTLKPSEGDKLELGTELKATLVTIIEFQTESEQSPSLVVSDSFACLLCLVSSSTVGAFADHICKHFSESGLTSGSLETETEADSLLDDSKKLPGMKDKDQDDPPSENAGASTTDNIILPIEQEVNPVSKLGLGTDDQRQNISLSTLDDANIDHLSARTLNPPNVITSSNQEISNTGNSDVTYGQTQYPPVEDQYEGLVEKSNLKATNGTSKPGNLMTDFGQDSDSVMQGSKDYLHHGKVSNADQAGELFPLEQKDLQQIDASVQLNENGKETQSLISNLKLDSDSFTFCLECKPGEKPFKCGICKKMFKKLKYIKDHIKLHVGKKSLVCEICGKSFRRGFNLKQHHKIHQSKENGEKQAVIYPTATEPTKEQSADTQNNESSHQLTDKSKKNLKGQAQSYTCDICSKTFQLQSYLKQHLKIHTSLKPYACEQCPMRFSQQAYLTKHRRVHTGEKPYKCGYCDKGFARSELLTRHTRTHTKEKPYSCPHCSRSFALYNTLKRHVRTHTGQKPFDCSVCGQAFTQRGNLSIHMRLHTGDRPFKCDKCQAGFIHSSNLKKHLKSCN